jgi:hypothetical protein
LLCAGGVAGAWTLGLMGRARETALRRSAANLRLAASAVETPIADDAR